MPSMNDKTLSSKERALLEAARREVAAKAPRAEPAAGAPAAVPGRVSPGAALSRLDAPTVLGWDHPAAQGPPPKAAEDKWARVAVLMEQERREAETRRRRMRRSGLAVVAAMAFIALIVLFRALIR
jgi:hypothetical protein